MRFDLVECLLCLGDGVNHLGGLGVQLRNQIIGGGFFGMWGGGKLSDVPDQGIGIHLLLLLGIEGLGGFFDIFKQRIHRIDEI